MHAGGCWLSLADHSSTERANRCSVASPNRGDLTRSNLARSLGSCWWSRRKARVCREKIKGKESETERERWEIKRDKHRERGVGAGGGGGVVPLGDHSWCLTPLVLLMCDAQEIDRLCKTQPTGENNNNTSQTYENGSSTGLSREETAVGEFVGRTAALVDVTFTHSGKVSWACETFFFPPSPLSCFTLAQLRDSESVSWPASPGWSEVKASYSFTRS